MKILVNTPIGCVSQKVHEILGSWLSFVLITLFSPPTDFLRFLNWPTCAEKYVVRLISGAIYPINYMYRVFISWLYSRGGVMGMLGSLEQWVFEKREGERSSLAKGTL